MNALKLYLNIYFFFGILYFLSAIMDWKYLSYFSKPLFIGIIILYYIEKNKKQINYYNLTILCLLFFSGVLNLLEGYNYFIYVLFINFLAYSILIFQLVKELKKLKFYKIERENYFSIILTSIFLICLLYISSFIVFDRSSEFYKVIFAYGIVSVCLTLSATLIYLAKGNSKNTYLVVYTLSTLICENFYGIYHYYYKLAFFRYSSIFCYIISFYFLVNYFLQDNEDKIDKIES